MILPTLFTSHLVGSNTLICPSIWPECEPKNQPGDLTKFAPSGCGFYGYQSWDGNSPFSIAPRQSASGGVIYFDNSIAKEDFNSLMRITGVSPAKKNFAAFFKESNQPGKDMYLVQMRLVSSFGLSSMFEVISSRESERLPEQKITMANAFWDFIEAEKEHRGTGFWQDQEKGLCGLFGGDGHYAREELCFGFMVENSYYRIYRIWSRAQLVTK